MRVGPGGHAVVARRAVVQRDVAESRRHVILVELDHHAFAALQLSPLPTVSHITVWNAPAFVDA